MTHKVWITLLVGVLALPAVATAHNLGHIFLPDGTCKELGSAKEAPLVGKDRTQLDLVPETPNPPRDEYGVSFVGYWGRTPVLPGRCPVVTGASLSGGSTAGAPGSSATPAGGRSQASPPANTGPTGPWMSSRPKKEK